MCEFCLQHGEGKKWYLEAKNYAEDLLSDVQRRKFMVEFNSRPVEELVELAEGMDSRLDELSRAPALVRRVFRWHLVRQAKKQHYGQVVPIEEIEQVFGFVNSIARMACICRLGTQRSEQRYCYGISMAPPEVGPYTQILLDPSYHGGPILDDMEKLTREEALAALRDHEQEGLIHSVWTFITPYIGGICNCDRIDCMALRITTIHHLPYLFRAEYVAAVNSDLCNGCRACMRACQFGAIGYSATLDKATIEPRLCYGCGVCRAHCARNAITLSDRSSVPAAARLW